MKLGRRAYIRVLSLALGKQGRPTLVTEREWDHLILLDACRHDTMEAVLSRDFGRTARVPFVFSPGSDTFEWLAASIAENPSRHRLADVALVSGTPYHSRAYFEQQGWPFPYRHAFDLWRDPFWDHDWNTCRPETVTTVAIDAAQKVDRLLVHYVQPHFPSVVENLADQGAGIIKKKILGQEIGDAHYPIWKLIESGSIPLRRALHLYEDNLRTALRSVQTLVSALDGRVVITSDHGNLFGEYGLYGHPGSLRVPELVMVPWIEVEGGQGDFEELMEGVA